MVRTSNTLGVLPANLRMSKVRRISHVFTTEDNEKVRINNDGAATKWHAARYVPHVHAGG